MRAGLGVCGCAMGLLLGPNLALAASGVAAGDATYTPPARLLAGGDSAARERVIDAVQKHFNATVVRVTETTVKGRPALALRLLSEQRVWSVVVDAATGEVLSGG